VNATLEERPLFLSEPPKLLNYLKRVCMSLEGFIFYLLFAILTFPVPIPSIPKPFPVSRYSCSASSPNGMRFSYLRISVSPNRSFVFLNLSPPLLRGAFEKGLSSGLFNLGYFGYYILSKRCNRSSLNLYPVEPSGVVLN